MGSLSHSSDCRSVLWGWLGLRAHAGCGKGTCSRKAYLPGPVVQQVEALRDGEELTAGSPGGLCLAKGDGLQQRHRLAEGRDAIAGQPKAGGERHILRRHRTRSRLRLSVF